jgi:adenine-specific DNA-methyltransferase
MQKVIGTTVKKDGELLESLDFDSGGISKKGGRQGGGGVFLIG